MIPADAMQGWHDFFVAISINLTRILEFQHLPARAAEALLALVSVLAIATFALIPRQSFLVCGIEIGGTGLVVWELQSLALARTWKGAHPQAKRALRVLANQLPPLPFIVAGGFLAAGHFNGIYWVVPGVLLSFAAGIFGAWILLIEIQR